MSTNLGLPGRDWGNMMGRGQW